jgi:hypothetical protein
MRLNLYAKTLTSVLQSLPLQQNYSFYSIILFFRAMDTPFSGAIRRPKRKLSTQLDLRNSSLFSQNSSISLPVKKRKKHYSFSQSQPTQLIQKTSIYPESPISRIPNLQLKRKRAKYSSRSRRKRLNPSISHNTLRYLLLCTLGPP